MLHFVEILRAAAARPADRAGGTGWWSASSPWSAAPWRWSACATTAPAWRTGSEMRRATTWSASTSSDASVDFPIFDAKTRSLKKAVLGRAGGRIGTELEGADHRGAARHHAVAAQGRPRRRSSGTTARASRRCCGCMSGIYEPTRGRASVVGKVAPVFDLAVGMDPEISGLENILIRGLFLGMTRKQMEARVDDIAEFTELGDYLSMPLRTYSTGMRVRLALGVVTSIDPEILLLDEGIGAVDAEFLAKARARLVELVERSGILVFASHSDEFLADLCDTAIWMEHGTIREHGPLRDVLRHYKGRDVLGRARAGERAAARRRHRAHPSGARCRTARSSPWSSPGTGTEQLADVAGSDGASRRRRSTHLVVVDNGPDDPARDVVEACGMPGHLAAVVAQPRRGGRLRAGHAARAGAGGRLGVAGRRRRPRRRRDRARHAARRRRAAHPRRGVAGGRRHRRPGPARLHRSPRAHLAHVALHAGRRGWQGELLRGIAAFFNGALFRAAALELSVCRTCGCSSAATRWRCTGGWCGPGCRSAPACGRLPAPARHRRLKPMLGGRLHAQRPRRRGEAVLHLPQPRLPA